jgi:hypothetical protein
VDPLGHDWRLWLPGGPGEPPEGVHGKFAKLAPGSESLILRASARCLVTVSRSDPSHSECLAQCQCAVVWNPDTLIRMVISSYPSLGPGYNGI